MALPSLSRNPMIRDVWAENLETEFQELREAIRQYPYVAMDTEFPGVVAKPVGSFGNKAHEFYYQTIRCNVNLLKIIQLGISVLNDRGEVPEKVCTWQFNFRFSVFEDMFAQESIDLLRNGGINFDYFKTQGIEMAHFAELLISSGLVLNPQVTWLSFHSGYDFGYLLKMVTGKELPERSEEFAANLHLFFPTLYDTKYMLRSTDVSHNLGLDALADILRVRRIGAAHQAGSDALLTGHVFFKLVRERMDNKHSHLKGVVYGLSEDAASNSTPVTAATGSPTTTGPGGAGVQSPSGNFPTTPLMSMVMHEEPK